uniref:GTD-binding domain-containing protein n=1 Tax=Oryza punctata TaxID=4537 RepID=A0A0E0MME8_ORYPU
MVRELIAVVARAALQWALSSLLLANGAAFCLIAAAASWLRLAPPCLLCAGVHRLLCSASADDDDAHGQERVAFRHLLCDAHVAAIATAAASEPENKKQQQPDQQKMISASDGAEEKRDAAEVENSDKPGGMEGHRVVSIGSEICEQDHAGGDQRSTAGDDGDGDGPYVSLFELAPIVARAPQDEDGHGHEDSHAQEVFDDLPAEVRRDGAMTVGRLVAALRAQRSELEAVRAELDGERRAGAEAAEYQRQLEEQGEFDREAVRLAMQLVHEAETEKHALQRQLDACRVKAQLYDYEAAATDHDAAGDGGGGDNNNYQSLVDFLPASVFSSSPDLANLLKLYTEGNGGGRRQRDGVTDAPAPVVTEVVEEEEEEEEEVAVVAIGGVDSNENGDAATTIAIAGDSLHERSSDHLESTEVSMMR